MANEDQTAEFGVGLDADDLIGEAESAAQALERLRGTIDDDVAALAGMQRAMKNIKGGGAQFDEQVKRLQHDIEAKKKSIATSQAGYMRLGGDFQKVTKAGRGFDDRIKSLLQGTKGLGGGLGKTGGASGAFADELTALSKSAGLLPGPLGQIVSRLGSMRSLMTAAAASKFVLVAAMTALVAVIGIAINKLFEYGKAQREARRNELLRLEGLTKLRFWFQRIPGDAKEMQRSIDQVSASSSLGRDKIAGYSEELYRMGFRGQNLADALDAFQIKAATQGEAAAHYWANWNAGIALTGGSIKKAADRVREQLGGIARKQLESTEAQTLKLHESWNMLFSDLKMDEYLHQWRLVNDLLSQSTASGRALKQIVELILQPLIDASTSGAPILKRFFQGAIIEAQRLTIAVLTVRLWFKRWLGPIEGDWNPAKNALNAGRAIVILLAGAFAYLAVTVLAATWPFLLAAAAIYSIFNTARLLNELWDEIDWSGMGTAIWKGIVSGIKKGKDWVVSSVKELAKTVAWSFKMALGIESPSKVFAALGIEIPEGIALGVNQGRGVSEAAVANVVPREIPAPVVAASATPNIPYAAPDIAAPSPVEARGAAAAASKSVSVTTGDIHVHTDAKDPEGIAVDIKRELERVLESIALQLGAPVTGTGVP
jgi:hypothetical protein